MKIAIRFLRTAAVVALIVAAGYFAWYRDAAAEVQQITDATAAQDQRTEAIRIHAEAMQHNRDRLQEIHNELERVRLGR